MSYSHVWFSTKAPENLVDLLCEDVKSFDSKLIDSKVISDNHENVQNLKIRSGKNAWIPASHWISGFIWHYINLANETNFLYDVRSIDSNNIQYSHYEVGDFYRWHGDWSIDHAYKPEESRALQSSVSKDQYIISGESSRKLSFSMQLSDPSEYTGGELQLLDSATNVYTVPKERGIISIFDSRLSHRVRKVKSGCRKSLVGWAVGPRWR